MKVSAIYGIIPIVLFALLISCQPRKSSGAPLFTDSLNSDPQCYLNGNLSAEERRKKFPFQAVPEIRIVSFVKNYEQLPFDKDSLLRTALFTNNIVLQQEQIDSLTNVLFNYNYSPQTQLFSKVELGCYDPRHAIVFLTKDKKVKYYLELCFECNGYRSNLPDSTWGSFCDGKYKLIKKSFAFAGVSYFGPGDPK
jgi:hypothetical protein